MIDLQGNLGDLYLRKQYVLHVDNILDHHVEQKYAYFQRDVPCISVCILLNLHQFYTQEIHYLKYIQYLISHLIGLEYTSYYFDTYESEKKSLYLMYSQHDTVIHL